MNKKNLQEDLTIVFWEIILIILGIVSICSCLTEIRTKVSEAESSNMVAGEEYLVRDVTYSSDIKNALYLYLEKGEERFQLTVPQCDFVTADDVSLSIYPGDYIKYLGDNEFEWIPNYNCTNSKFD